MAASNLHTVAFFGATGGCNLACLVHALEAGICCSACMYLVHFFLSTYYVPFYGTYWCSIVMLTISSGS